MNLKKIFWIFFLLSPAEGLAQAQSDEPSRPIVKIDSPYLRFQFNLETDIPSDPEKRITIPIQTFKNRLTMQMACEAWNMQFMPVKSREEQRGAARDFSKYLLETLLPQVQNPEPPKEVLEFLEALLPALENRDMRILAEPQAIKALKDLNRALMLGKLAKDLNLFRAIDWINSLPLEERMAFVRKHSTDVLTQEKFDPEKFKSAVIEEMAAQARMREARTGESIETPPQMSRRDPRKGRR